MDADQESRNREEAKAGLREELTDVVGEEGAARAERKGALDAAVDGERPKTVSSVLSQSRNLLVVSFFVALTVGAVIALITGAWWFLIVALVIHGIGTVFVVGSAMSLATQTESPDPRTSAALQARGVANPDAALTQAVDAASDDDGDGGESERTAVTPSPRSHPVGEPQKRPEGDRA